MLEFRSLGPYYAFESEHSEYSGIALMSLRPAAFSVQHALDSSRLPAGGSLKITNELASQSMMAFDHVP